jgi:hypothetical protein
MSPYKTSLVHSQLHSVGQTSAFYEISKLQAVSGTEASFRRGIAHKCGERKQKHSGGRSNAAWS